MDVNIIKLLSVNFVLRNNEIMSIGSSSDSSENEDSENENSLNEEELLYCMLY